ncbi:hypothetical protein [Acetobacter sp. DsW_063]|uniref:hypothetical protein n=1 Tax=Acetobacter sp. DsW_063 TaxID=1514894 RepID=UPI000A37DBDA|nr:hypothetical protein [Acetobacter sp. DsW_063]OUJ14712.1 hypothetical protein HK28_11840 [Acetobacter sp. DsW_063]
MTTNNLDHSDTASEFDKVKIWKTDENDKILLECVIISENIVTHSKGDKKKLLLGAKIELHDNFIDVFFSKHIDFNGLRLDKITFSNCSENYNLTKPEKSFARLHMRKFDETVGHRRSYWIYVRPFDPKNVE